MLGPLASYLQPLIGQAQPEIDQLTQQLLKSQGPEAQALSQKVFQDALLTPALDTYNRDVAPGIAGDYANIGGTLSSRRDKTLTQGRTDVIKGAQSSFASILPQVMAFPTQQTLSQIQGLGALQQQRFTPFQNALSFALQPTRQAAQQPAGPGWSLLGAGINALGFGLGGGFGALGGGGGGGGSPNQAWDGLPIGPVNYNR